ncbi:MAG: diacylglycerol kinase family lipid kinase [Bacilli bacterium]|nr:diacylglycerol kinase family lipid kinase [Bacilli bacterium]
MKKCVVIYNPNSGKGQMTTCLDEFKNILYENDYEASFIPTEYHQHAIKIIEELDEKTDLVISAGGDGTFNEAVTGNFKRKKKLLLAHIPVGTCNDVGVMFGYGKNPIDNLKLLLAGEVHNIDICLINNQPFVYVAGFGKFIDIPYATPRELKKKFGYLAYLIEGLKSCFRKIPMYDLTYKVNGETFKGSYSLMLITNANRIAGFNNFYKDVKLDDNKFEVFLCNLPRKVDFIRSVYMLKTNRITQAPGVYFYKTDKLEIEFENDIFNNWCIDGEKLDETPKKYTIEINKDLKIMMPSKNIETLFTKKWYNFK